MARNIEVGTNDAMDLLMDAIQGDYPVDAAFKPWLGGKTRMIVRVDGTETPLVLDLSRDGTWEARYYTKSLLRRIDMTDKQKSVINCAYADLVGVYQCAIRDGNGGANNGHDWDAHLFDNQEMEETFDFIEPAPLEN